MSVLSTLFLISLLLPSLGIAGSLSTTQVEKILLRHIDASGEETALLASYIILKILRQQPHVGPFILTLLIIFLGYVGLAISLWPNIIPPNISFREVAAPTQSMGFALVGALFIIPFILAYTAWSYYVF